MEKAGGKWLRIGVWCKEVGRQTGLSRMEGLVVNSLFISRSYSRNDVFHSLGDSFSS